MYKWTFGLLIGLWLASSSALAGTRRVELDGSGDFTTIQDALDAAAAGDSILVGPGEFTHSRLIPEWEGFRATAAIYKSGLKIIGSGTDLTVVGEDTVDWYYNVFVAGDPLAPISDFSVSDLTVRGGLKGMHYECDGLTVERCRFQLSDAGIFGVDVDLALVRDCEFYTYGNGILVIPGSTDWTIANCTIDGSDKGIMIDGTMGARITDCLVQNCDVGIEFYYSAGEIIRTHVIGSPDTENGVGIGSVMFSRLLLVDSVIDYTQNSTWWALSVQPGDFTGHGNQIRGGGNSSVDFFAYRDGNYPFDFHNNDIYKADQYAMVLLDLDSNPSAPILHYDLTNNYWGTTDPDSIAAWIDDANDHPGDLNYLGIVDFDPFLVDQVPVRKKSLSDIKGLFRPELQPIVGQSAHGFDRRSSEIGLSYAGTPHPAMGVDVNKGAQPGDYEDLLVTMPGSPARLYRCRALTMKGVPYFEDVTFTVFGANPPYELHGASDADFDTDAVLGPASRASARTDP